ncbi:dihydrodipicolinate reductase C-terminal domain-containing protein [Micromonospora sp. CPCC 206060]|uniref:dihydrodipicolinate reductase C-terminal domain-containing protein n=1 Tax=Micromonospora sp. CPCC 206060 TaxID=3122406 RepID=UPI002FF1267C
MIGAGGRLGSRIVAAAGTMGVEVTLRGTRAAWTGGVPDVLVDVSLAPALPDVLGYCHTNKVPLLSASSGLTPEHRAGLAALAELIPVLRADNLSLGNWIQRGLTSHLGPMFGRLHAEGLGSVTVVDRHPTYKKDRPSATALALADRATGGADGALDVRIESIRAGMPVCEHDVRLALGDEELVVRHAVRDWAAYAPVAVRAALWLTDRPAALHSMDDFYTWLLTTSATDDGKE